MWDLREGEGGVGGGGGSGGMGGGSGWGDGGGFLDDRMDGFVDE